MARLLLFVNLFFIFFFIADAASASSSSSSTSSSSAAVGCSCRKKPVKCKANEEFSNCIQSLGRRLKCSQQGKPVPCARTPKKCRKGCVCRSGFLKTAKGICVPETQCYGKLVCKDTEVVNACPNYSFDDYCPTSEEDAQLSTKVVSEPCEEDPKCTCRFNYKRLKNGTCVPTEKCPPFKCSGENQKYYSCPPICPSDDCSQATPTGRCPLPGRIGIVLTCMPNCRCIPGYWKNNGVCVPYAECPGKCRSNEEFSSCAQIICRAQNCKQIGQPIACPIIDGPESCEERCVCVEGTLRDAKGNCVPENQCPVPTCGKNEAFEGCPNRCSPVGCPKSYKEEQERLADCISPAVCLPAECRCLPDYRRNSKGKCIYIGKCPGICPNNEEFSNCTQGSGRAQSCTQSQPITSSDIVEGSCEPGCICKKGTLRNANGDCVPEDQCPDQPCGENEVFNNCPNACSPVSCPKSYKEEQERLADCFSAAVCLSAECTCLPDYRRDSKGNCIYIGQCPGICPKNEEFSNCTQASGRAQSCTQSQPITSSDVEAGSCKAGCICKKGTLRNANGECVPEDECPAPQCRRNEVLSCVYDCPPETTCRTRGIQYDCQEPTKKCEDKCVCKPGFYRNAIGDCITEKECDKCGPNQFFSCGSACDNKCSNIATQNRTNCPIVNIVCNPKCYCDDGFARDDKNQCIPVEKCPKRYICKGHNEEYVKCKQTCPSELCTSIVSRLDCSKQPPCKPGCACKSGFFRVHKYSPCGAVCDCPQMKGSPECLKKLD